MKILEKKYKVKIVKYNFKESFMSYSEIFDEYPQHQDLQDVLKECNERYPMYEDCSTTVHIEEFFNVSNQ